MGARRPKPSALKERTSVRPNLGLSRLFSVANALVPRGQEAQEPDDKTIKLADPRLADHVPANPLDKTNVSLSRGARAKEESEYGTAVVVPNRKRPAAATEGTKTQPISVRTSVTKLKNAKSKKFQIPKKYFALLFLVPAIGLFSYAYFTGTLSGLSGSKQAGRISALTPDQIKERLEFHREITGSHLNRERIDVQIQNFQQAPNLGPNVSRVKPPNMMDGLPLTSEPNTYSRNSKPDLPSDPTYSEAKTAYGLQEEQDHAEFEKLAQKEWVKEFVENARKGGYNVKIDQFGNVKSTRIPADQLGPLPETNPVFNEDP